MTSPVLEYGAETMALEKEIKRYHEVLPTLLEHKGKYVVIHESDVLGTFSDYGDALDAAYKAYGTKPFLVKRIEQIETPQRLTRNLGVCHT